MTRFNGVVISKTSAMHFAKLGFRILLFLITLAVYISDRLSYTRGMMDELKANIYILVLLFAVFAVEMALRFFRSEIESPGCQKQFLSFYKPTGVNETPRLTPGINTFAVVASWVALNAVVAALYYAGFIDEGILILLCLAYSVCDMICILFFCPFQTWMMKNKCCGTCRIYNWDYIMMFTPCLFIHHPLARLLFTMAFCLFIQWEYLYRKHPERFAENTNAALQCANCTEKLCAHKKQLQRYLVVFRARMAEETERLNKERERLQGEINKLGDRLPDLNDIPQKIGDRLPDQVKEKLPDSVKNIIGSDKENNDENN